MCGIYGYLKLGGSLPPEKLKSIMIYLAYANMERGHDSTGIAVINRDNHIFNLRKTKDAVDFFNKAKVRRYIMETLSHKTKVVLGHTRQATTGDITVKNAMPFVCDNTIGVHNGVINNYKELQKEHGLNYTTTCDSESIFRLIDLCFHNEERIKRLKALSGYYSVAFWDKRFPDKAYLAKSDNTLAVFRDKAGKYILFSSEALPIERASVIFNLNLEEIHMPSYSLLEVDLSNGKDSLTKFEPPIPTYSNVNHHMKDKTHVFRDWCAYCGQMKKVSYNHLIDDFVCKRCKKQVYREFEREREEKRYSNKDAYELRGLPYNERRYYELYHKQSDI